MRGLIASYRTDNESENHFIVLKLNQLPNSYTSCSVEIFQAEKQKQYPATRTAPKFPARESLFRNINHRLV